MSKSGSELNLVGEYYREKPVPISYLSRDTSHGEVRVLVPADPEKIAAWRSTDEYKRLQKTKKVSFNLRRAL